MEKIQYLSIDLETRSGTDLTKSGVYRYVEDADFDILLFMRDKRVKMDSL